MMEIGRRIWNLVLPEPDLYLGAPREFSSDLKRIWAESEEEVRHYLNYVKELLRMEIADVDSALVGDFMLAELSLIRLKHASLKEKQKEKYCQQVKEQIGERVENHMREMMDKDPSTALESNSSQEFKYIQTALNTASQIIRLTSEKTLFNDLFTARNKLALSFADMKRARTVE